MTKIQYLSLSKPRRILVDIGNFFKGIGVGFVNFFKGLPAKFAKLGKTIASPFVTLVDAFKNGTWFTRMNFLVCGFSQLFHKEIARGVLYLLFQIVFIWFFISVGIPNLGQLGTLGTFAQNYKYYDVDTGSIIVAGGGDNSFNILLYCIVTFILLAIFIVLWYLSIRDAKSLQDNIAVGRLSKNSQFFKDLTDKSYQNLLLAVPLVGLVGFTVIPIIFMVLIGFTNYSGMSHAYLFDWVALDNFANVFGLSSSGNSDVVKLFLRILAWTLAWAAIATFTNYFLGMAIALLINRKGIKLKKLWRTVLITTIAVPQFVSLLLINKMLANDGLLTKILSDMHLITPGVSPFSDNVWASRILIIVINMWVGVPYTMLICSGLLMNIPEDLYESARIDGASPFKMFSKITLPYMLFITLPYLISQFVGNINNFNIIFLLSGGGPGFGNQLDIPASFGGNAIGETDLLITWIYKMSMQSDAKDYSMACVLGMLIFVIVAFFSLVFYGRSGSVKNEEDFQ